MNKDEVAGGILIFLFGAVTSYFSMRMPIGSFRAAGSGLFPLCLGILLMVLSGAFVLGILQKEGGKREAKSSEATGSTRQVISFLGTIVLAILLFRYIGYPLMSFLLLLGLLRTLGMKKWAWNVLLSFVSAGVSYILFVQWLKIPLPKGWIGL